MNLRPAIKKGNRLYVGTATESHDHIKENNNLPDGPDKEHGFTSDGRTFLNRIQAVNWLKKYEPGVYMKVSKKVPSEGLHSHIYAAAKGIVQKLTKKEKTGDLQPGETEKETEVTDLTDQKALVIDYGYFMNLARRLSESDGFGEVVYAPPWHSYNPTPDRVSVGMGIPGVTHSEDYDDHVDDSDIIIFPDVGDMAKQRRYRKNKAEGKLKADIFGMGDAEELELSRLKFKNKLKEVGLFQPEWGVIYGVDALRAKLMEEDCLWIKIDSKYRGIKETWYHDTYKSSKTQLDNLATALGVLRDTFMFIWEKPFGKVEGGADYFMSNGVRLPVGLRGFEGKNEWYVCKAERVADMPEPLKVIHNAMEPYFLEKKSSGKMSDEVRTDENGKGYWLDATIRFGDPPFGVDLRGWKNLPQIISACSSGKIVEPIPVAPYSVMLVLKSDMATEEPCPVDFEDENDSKHISLRRLHIAKDGQKYCVPLDHDNIIGSAVGFGETWQKAAEEALYYAERVRCRELSFKENVTDAIEETLEKAETCGWGEF